MTNEMWSGLFFYGILAVFTGIFADLSVRKSSKPLNVFFAFLTIFVPSIFAGVRFGIGTDYFNYLQGFINSTISGTTDSEFLYSIISKTVGFLGLDFQFVLFINAFITTIFIYLALRNHKNVLSIGLGMFLYMLLYYQMSYNIVRQVTALAILLYSLQYISKRNFKLFTLFIILAMGFHTTAIIFYPLYFLNWLYGSSKHKILKILSFSLLIVVIINLSSFLFPIVSQFEVFSYYANSYLKQSEEFNLSMGVFLRTLPFIISGFEIG